MIIKPMIVLFFLFVVGGYWIFSTGAPPDSHPIADGELSALRVEVREIIRPSCGSCHTSTLPTAKPKAVAVFDLKNEDWSATMKVEQLKNFNTRLKDFSPSEKEKIEKLLSSELATR